MNQIAVARAKLKNYRIKPNKSELKLLEMLEVNFPDKFIYNGGQLTINGLIPDFYCAEHHAIIELVGRKDLPKHAPEVLEDREKLFDQFGFKTKFVYQEDLKDEIALIQDVLFFIHFGLK